MYSALNQPTSNSSLKQRHLSHLNSQLAQLHANLSDFNELINTTSAQFKSIEKMGIMHGSLFMASHTVFENDNFSLSERQV
mmetsp:Transcript_4251/g.4214  ORF Transcript_4251/g.4214 Transcript_4251/m.4214 type:complete len:81 (+) Transcript_4251:38-280(+)